MSAHYAASLWGSDLNLSFSVLTAPPSNVPSSGPWRDAVDVTLHLVSTGKLTIEVPIGSGCSSSMCGVSADGLVNLDGWATDGVVHVVLGKIQSAAAQHHKRVAVLSATEANYNLAGKSYHSEEGVQDRQLRMMSSQHTSYTAMLEEIQASDVVVAAISHGAGSGAAPTDRFKGCHWVFAAASNANKSVVVYDPMASTSGSVEAGMLHTYGERFVTLMHNWGCAGKAYFHYFDKAKLFTNKH